MSAVRRQGLSAVRAGRVAVVDGNQMFNRPGPRLVDALEFLVGLLHDLPDIIPQGFPWQPWQQQEAVANGAAGGAAEHASAASAPGGAAGADGTASGQEASQGGHAGPDGAAGGAGHVVWLPVPGTSSWPALSHDIEDAHKAACDAGSSTYLDPKTGFVVSGRWAKGSTEHLFEGESGCGALWPWLRPGPTAALFECGRFKRCKRLCFERQFKMPAALTGRQPFPYTVVVAVLFPASHAAAT